MSIDAILAGLMSAAIFFLFSVACALVLKRIARPGFLAIGTFLTIEAAVLLLTPPPVVLLAKAGYLEIGDPGHAGYRFMAPYFLSALIIVCFCVFYLRGKKAQH